METNKYFQTHPDDAFDAQDDRPPSKSQLKRDMDALQALGEQLVNLSEARLAKTEMPEKLRDAVLAAKAISKHGARRRQLQYIGRLMRDADPVPIQAAIDEVNGVSAALKARQHALEQLRARFLEDEQVIGEIAANYPGADLQHLRQLRRNALKEASAGKPPRAFRELFRLLRALSEPASSDDDQGADGSGMGDAND